MRRRALIVSMAVIVLGAMALLWSRTSNDGGPATPIYLDETAAAGITHAYDGEFPFFVGGGVATFDCNDDGFPDLYFAGGERPAALYVNESTVGGALRFVAKPSSVTDLTLVTGAYPLDVDNDGLLDLAVLRRGGNAILGGRGNCEFDDVTEKVGIDPDADWTVSFSATWETGNQLPTMVFGSYLVPDTYECGTSKLWRPTGAAYSAAVELPGHCTLSVLFSDWNRDGRVDLRVSNDRNYDRKAREQLWRIRAGEPPYEYRAADGWRDLVIWGMGIASHDLTGDGKPEIYLTSQSDNKLQTLEPGVNEPTYRDIALARGVTAHRPYVGGDILPSTAWHPEFDDVNNDGFIDLFVAKGNVEGQIDYAANDPNNLLLGTADGTFVERGSDSGIANDSRSRGAALVDLNLDGLLDLVVVNRRVQVEVRRNVGDGTSDSPRTMGRWLAVRLRQPAPNTSAVGAFVEVRTTDEIITREHTVGGGHASGEMGWIHFGVGNSSTAEIRVTFPGAAPGEWQAVDTNSFYDLQRGATPVRWQPARDRFAGD